MAVAGAAVLQAGAANITIGDYNTSPLHGWNTGPSGAGLEDNETEYGTIRGQRWDLEAFATNPQDPLNQNNTSPMFLNMIGGYDFLSSSANGNSTVPGMNYGNGVYVSGGIATPGDLFIKKASGSEPGPGGQPIVNPLGSIAQNATIYGPYPANTSIPASAYGYDYVIAISQINAASLTQTGPNSGSGTIKVYQVFGDTWFDTVGNDQFIANPWKLHVGAVGGSANHVVELDPIRFTYQIWNTGAVTPGVTAALLGSGLSPNSLKSDNGANYGATPSEKHMLIQMDMGWYSTAQGDTTYFHYTMGCGNDMLLGATSESFYQTPDGGMSLMLLGFGLSGLTLFRRKQ